ncbi:unnamed protein product [Caenorhabditis angaria]|uniref:Galectin n=1 Tax=Caenorhabditis angaria TaxID=860376 RepID=A0A9P1IL03_9PELO|nr:unnamed protein product [Caenorhabditis angaria]
MISKFLIFSAIFALGYGGTSDIVSLNCGRNFVTKTSNEQFYSFNREVNEGSITFHGRVPEKIEAINFYLHRGVGNALDVDYNTTLFIGVKGNEPTNFHTRSLDNKNWTPAKQFKACGLAKGQSNSLKIEISRKVYRISEGETFLQKYPREIDAGAYLKSATILGNFNITSIDLECRA